MFEQIDRGNLPQHIAVIMDGNGRWAKGKGAARIFGHRNAILAVREATEGCAELGVKYLTLYAFSTENWSRPKMEVDGLMNLLVSTISDELKTLMENQVSLHAIGNIAGLPSYAHDKLLTAIDQTKNNKGLKLVLALNYSGKWDIEQAMKRIAEGVLTGKIEKEQIDSNLIATYLNTSNMPDPELMIRTSGEMRISNFLLWQLAYTELYFTEVLWPDFRKADLEMALLSYQQRERRFGKISEQVSGS